MKKAAYVLISIVILVSIILTIRYFEKSQKDNRSAYVLIESFMTSGVQFKEKRNHRNLIKYVEKLKEVNCRKKDIICGWI